MNQKSLSVQNKTHKQILSFLKDRKISKVYSEFSSSLNSEENLAVAVSGGPDSMAMSYLAKCYSIKNKIKVKFFFYLSIQESDYVFCFSHSNFLDSYLAFCNTD